jgi:hypothetical protein
MGHDPAAPGMNAARRQLRRNLSDRRGGNRQHFQLELTRRFGCKLGLGVAEPGGLRLAVLIEPEQHDCGRRGCLGLGLSMFIGHD